MRTGRTPPAAVPYRRCDTAERWCHDLNVCSNKGRCNALLASLGAVSAGSGTASSSASRGSAAPAAPVAFVPVVDKVPPRLRLLGGGVAAVTPTGAAIMMDNVTWNADWRDPGATAADAVDGDVTDRIQSLGVGEWQPSVKAWLRGGCLSRMFAAADDHR